MSSIELYGEARLAALVIGAGKLADCLPANLKALCTCFQFFHEIESAPGVDLGTWIGESEENRAWDLLGLVRDSMGMGALSDTAPEALHALYAAEGSDWFWWFGDDQDLGCDQETICLGPT
ncbi:MAG: hypothetical protein ABI627_29020 [Polyangiaceae bacterium]